MKVPPNYGSAYVREFDALFASVAQARKVPLVPFFFEGSANATRCSSPTASIRLPRRSRCSSTTSGRLAAAPGSAAMIDASRAATTTR
jgi:hypothetical protein